MWFLRISEELCKVVLQIAEELLSNVVPVNRRGAI